MPPFLAWTLFRCQSAQEIVVYQAAYRRCTVHFYRKVLPREARPKCSKASAMSKAIHAIESRETAAKTLPNAVELDSLRYRQESCALFRQPHKPAVRCGYPSSRVTSR